MIHAVLTVSQMLGSSRVCQNSWAADDEQYPFHWQLIDSRFHLSFIGSHREILSWYSASKYHAAVGIPIWPMRQDRRGRCSESNADVIIPQG